MGNVTIDEIRNILIGTELDGVIERAYKVSYAVPDSHLGLMRGDNASGFSFGIVQLDIGSNSYAKAAYSNLLDNALQKGHISQDDAERLASYSGVQRPDLHDKFRSTYKQDREYLADNVFSVDGAIDIIDEASNAYINNSLLGSVNRFLDAVEEKWGTDTVFNPDHPDYARALSAMVSISNRTGGLRESTAHFLNTKPVSIFEVQSRYESIFKNENSWFLVEQGAEQYSSQCFPAGTAITMADGSLKPIEQIVAGDQVASFSGFGALVPASVTQAFSKGVAPLVAVNGTQLRTTAGHVFASAQRRERVPAGPGDTQQKLTAAELLALARSQPDTFRFAFKRIDQMVEGEDLLLLEDGRFHAFTGIRDLGTAEQIYNFTEAGLHSYVAGGFPVHNDSLSALIDSMGVEGINWIDRGADKLTNPWLRYYFDQTHDDNPNNDGLAYIAKFGADFVEGVAHVGAAIWDSTIGALNRWSDRRKAKKIEKLHDAGVDIRDFLSPA